jgi:hypothetical protein
MAGLGALLVHCYTVAADEIKGHARPQSPGLDRWAKNTDLSQFIL